MLACVFVPSLTFWPHTVFEFDKLMWREEAAAEYQVESVVVPTSHW